MKDSVCPIQWHEAVGGDYYRLGFRHEAGTFQPGQFAMVKVPGDEILLRRPFCLCQVKEGAWEILYKVVGSGTRMMATLAPGDHLEVFGPLGHPFSHSSKPVYFFVAGGYGIAPFLGFSRLLAGQKKEIHIFYGAKTKGDLLLQEDFRALDVSLHLSTEDGSVGHHGLVTESLEKTLQTADPRQVFVAACGPHGLLAAVAQLGTRYGVECEVSMEATMGCGTGVCLGCVVETVDHRMIRTCMEGPVFSAETILWKGSHEN